MMEDAMRHSWLHSLIHIDMLKSLDMSRPSLSTVVQNAYEYGEIVTAPSTAVHRRLAAPG